MFNQSQSFGRQDTLNTNLNTSAANLSASSNGLDTKISALNLQTSASLNNFSSSILAANGSNASADSNNTMSTATAWAPLNGWFAHGESIGGTDTNDYFSFSLNSTSDLSMVMSGLSADVDIRLLDANGNEIALSNNSGTHSIGGNAYKVGTSEAFDVTLNAGSYYFKASSYDGGVSDYKMNFLAKPVTYGSDWYSQNLKDSGIKNWAREFGSDGKLGRNEMMLIMRSALDGGTVDANELSDLRKLIGSFQMDDYVKNLSTKVAFGSSANAKYQEESLGNLVAGSSATHLDKLIGKWFLGNDLPSTSISSGGTISYGLANTSGLSGRNQVLFGQDSTSSQVKMSTSDIKQGSLADCYFVASLGALAGNSQHGLSSINNMFIDNGDGTFTVRFYGQNDGKVTTGAEYVTVNQYLSGSLAGYDNQNTGLWVALAEKAYAQFSELGISQRSSTANNYGSIEYGSGFRVMNAITGVTQGGVYANYSTVGSATPLGGFLSLSDIASRLNQGWAMTADTVGSDKAVKAGIVGGHEYIVVSANTSNGTLTLYNPWGSTSAERGETNGYKTISYNDFKNVFDVINVG
ncbi:hypothetical protein NIES2101_34950 [Calothrix sp. HK-06]|nr:hypothetical protein NIES2101_34950 [Calothrix sp. HK-06]